MKTDLKEIKFEATFNIEELMKDYNINLESDTVLDNLGKLELVILRQEGEYKAYIYNIELDDSILVMQSDFEGNSKHGLFAIYLSNFKPITFEAFLLSALSYIESEEEGIEEWLDDIYDVDYDDECDYDDEECVGADFEDCEENSN